MPELFDADASPEKKLFISLITRDISLSDAIIDLLDNSVNAAMRPIRNSFSSTEDFHKLFTKRDVKPEVTIRVRRFLRPRRGTSAYPASLSSCHASITCVHSETRKRSGNSVTLCASACFANMPRTI